MQNQIRAWVLKNCRLEKPQYLFVSEETDSNILEQAWDIVKTSGINILSDKTLGVVAIVNGKVIGSLFVPEYGRKFSFDIVVSPEYQHQGIGMELAKIGKGMFDPEQYPEGMELDAVSPGGKHISEKLGLEKTDEIGEHSIYRNRIAWVLKNCRFAQQQMLIDYDEPGTFTESPKELKDPKFQKDVKDFNLEEQEEFLTGFFHVTTNLPAVLHWGALKSRNQLGCAVPGLGGGGINEAPYAISVTYDINKAYNLYDMLKFAAEVAQGQIKASAIFDIVSDHYGNPDVLEDSPVRYVFRDFGVSRRVIKDEYLEGIEQELDRRIIEPEQKYDFMQSLDDAFGKEEAKMQENATDFSPSRRVGFTVPFETFSQINPVNIAILKIEVRKGAEPEHVFQELELRFDPDDCRLPINPVVKK